MSTTKKAVFTSLCIALCLVLPLLFHSIPGAGIIFLPMYLPVFLCGLTCGWSHGLVCGLMAPVLSSLLTGMPPPAILPSMTLELALYGALCGILMHFIKMKSEVAAIEITIIASMLCGRMVSGLCNTFLFGSGPSTLVAWLVASFVHCLPGIAMLVVLLPVLILVLRKSHMLS